MRPNLLPHPVPAIFHQHRILRHLVPLPIHQKHAPLPRLRNLHPLRQLHPRLPCSGGKPLTRRTKQPPLPTLPQINTNPPPQNPHQRPHHHKEQPGHILVCRPHESRVDVHEADLWRARGEGLHRERGHGACGGAVGKGGDGAPAQVGWVAGAAFGAGEDVYYPREMQAGRRAGGGGLGGAGALEEGEEVAHEPDPGVEADCGVFLEAFGGVYVRARVLLACDHIYITTYFSRPNLTCKWGYMVCTHQTYPTQSPPPSKTAN